MVERVNISFAPLIGGFVSVEVRIPTVFRKFTDGDSVVSLEPGTVGGLVDQLEQRYPGFKGQLITEDGTLHRFVNVYVNDEDARYLDQLDTKVDEGDTVSLLPSVAGGR
jgi:molybdopterin synthase sulfur carrier subunit